MSSLFDLSGQVALITGGSKGFGVEFANALATHGCDVALIARSEADLVRVSEEIAEKTGRSVLPFPCDVTDSSAVNATVDKVMAAYGRIDILINNAGVNMREPITEISDENWRTIQGVNLDGVFFMCRAVIPHMQKANYGRIVNVGSALSLVGLPNRTSYTSSKGAVLQLTRTVALELAETAITVNCLCPGPFATDMNAPLVGKPAGDAFIKKTIPMNRWGELQELWPAILFMTSPASGYMTGASITVDGGWVAR